MNNVLYDDFKELEVEEEPNDSGILMYSKGFSAPKDGDADFFQREKEHAGAEIGVAMAQAGVFKVQQVGSPYSDDEYRMGPEFEDYYKLYARIMPRPRSCEERVRELEEEKQALLNRVRDLENKLNQVKEAFPDEI